MVESRLTLSLDERTRLAKTRVGEVVLGKWRLERLIGVGGMAAVFEATHRNGSTVAIKILHPDLAGYDEMRERFLSEGYVANRVSHPGAVTVRDEGTTEDGAVFLVMDLLRGQSLAERLEATDQPLSVGEVLEIASQLLDVLVHAHGRGIVHRDIKPENVFLTYDGRVRLLDFGIARVDRSARSHATEPGSTLGTPAFMPPEQALGRWQDLDGRSDLWSLGATLYLLLSGHPVREHGSVTEQLLRAMTQPVISLGEVAALPRAVVAVVDRALAFERDDRFPDARSMQLAVRAAQDELSVPDSRAPLPPPSFEPVALSVRGQRAEARHKRPSIPTVRPVALSTPLPGAQLPLRTRSALPLYIAFGFALGLGIVVAGRLTVRPENVVAERPRAATASRSEAVLPAPSADASASAAAHAGAPAAAPTISVRRAPSRAPAKRAPDPLSRRK